MALGGARLDFAGTQRFEVVRVLGVGGMGVVYEVFDRERKGRVALKTLRSLSAEARIRFKNEFRSLQDLQHPNLVSLGELQEDEGQLFFTMELVRGVDFVVHVCRHEEGDAEPHGWSGSPAASSPPSSVPSGSLRHANPALQRATGMRPFDEVRLRAALGQLVQGLAALHAANKVHRDIKPSNVLVTAEGRVVILDFGLVTDVSTSRGGEPVVGTVHFMAPEQASGRPVGPEADLYSLGVMLYLALTGVYPFQFAPKLALDLKQRVEPPPPGQHVADLPADLAELTVELLHIDATRRPTARDVLRRLRVEEVIDEPPVLSQRFGFVGRRRELTELFDAFHQVRDGRAATRIIEGESGVGKSALLRRFVELIQRDALVLAGRCYEREAVPYKAVDELVDALSRHLSQRTPMELGALLPSNADLLGVVFPVLRTVAQHSPPHTRRRAIDPLEIRSLVFAALRELLGKLAAERPLVLAVDDLQWADADSLALLSEVMRPSHGVSTPANQGAPAPLAHPTGVARPPLFVGARAMMLVAAIRTGAETSMPRFARKLSLPSHSIRHVTLERLSSAEAQELCAQLLRGAATTSKINVEALAEEAGGHPLFLDALVRHRMAHGEDGGPVRLEDVLWVRIGRLDLRARQVLDMISVAGGPLPVEVVARAVGADISEVTHILSILRAAFLVRTGGAGREEFVEVYHNRIRETVAGHLDAQAVREQHGRLARAFESTHRGELEALAGHWRAAGDIERAAEYAVRAAQQAEVALAFDRSARLYRMAIDLQTRGGAERRRLLARLGDALSSAGRGAKAAEAYMAASDGAPDAEAIDLGRRAAENLLRSGYVDAGMASLRKVLATVGMQVPLTAERALASLLFRRAQIRLRGLSFEERDVAEISQGDLMRIDICWSAALGLAIVDPVRGADFQARNLLLALKAGEPYRVARALAFEAAYLAVDGGPSAPRVAELLDAAGSISRRIDRPHAQGLVELVTGITSAFLGRFRESVQALDRADVIFRERCTGVAWERGSVHSFAIWALWYAGDIQELTRRVPRYLQEAEERGDRYLATNLSSSQSNAYWLVFDDPDAALRQAQDAIRSWSRQGFHLQGYFDLVARTQISLYRGDGVAAHRLIAERWPALESSLALRLQAVRIFMTHLRAAAALAACASTEDPAPLHHEVSRAVRRLEAERVPWSDALAAALRAAAAASRGETRGAAQILAEAVRRFDAAGMALYAAATRRCLGGLLGGDEGRAAVVQATTWMQDQGIVNPDRMTAMLVPGFPT